MFSASYMKGHSIFGLSDPRHQKQASACADRNEPEYLAAKAIRLQAALL